MYTVLFCCSAGGEFLPVNIIFKAKHLYTSWCSKGPKDARYNNSHSGWMETEQFFQWFKEIFLSHVKQLSGKKILFLDGHVSHVSLKLIDLAASNDVILYRLPSHTTHFLQPLDVSVFKQLKNVWRNELKAHLRSNAFRSLTNKEFPRILKTVLEKACKREMVITGFASTGIFPLNSNVIDQECLKIGTVATSNTTEKDASNSSNNSNQTSNNSSNTTTALSTNTLSPNTPNQKLSSTECFMKSVERITTLAAENIKNSVLKHLNFSESNKETNRESNVKLKRASYFNLTEDDVREELARANEEKKRKAEELNKKRIEREARKKAKIDRLQSIDNTINSVILESESVQNDETVVPSTASNIELMEERKCYNCNITWSSCSDKLHWRACESCLNWSCFLCADLNFLNDNEYFCNNCI
jgi:hypothetical protein